MPGTAASTHEVRAALAAAARGTAGRIRRMVLTLTAESLWQVLGHTLLDGVTQETDDVEPFTGIGFYARPPESGGNPEVVVVHVGDTAGAPLIIAARDEQTRQAVAQLDADETATFNSKSIAVHKADGTIEARSAAGTANALPTLAAIQQIYDALGGAINTLINVAPGGVAGAAAALPLQALQTALRDPLQGGALGWPSSTTVLKAE